MSLGLETCLGSSSSEICTNVKIFCQRKCNKQNRA